MAQSQAPGIPLTRPWASATDPQRLFNVTPQPAIERGAGDRIPSLERAMGPGAFTDDEPLWSPNNPLFWFGVIAAATFGFIGVSSSFHAGPFRARLNAGKT